MTRAGAVSGLLLVSFLGSLVAIAGDAPARMQANLTPIDGRDARLGLRGTAIVVMGESGPDLLVRAQAPVGMSGELLRVDACEGTVGWIRLQAGDAGVAEGSLNLRGLSAAPDCHLGDLVTLAGSAASARGQFEAGA